MYLTSPHMLSFGCRALPSGLECTSFFPSQGNFACSVLCLERSLPLRLPSQHSGFGSSDTFLQSLSQILFCKVLLSHPQLTLCLVTLFIPPWGSALCVPLFHQTANSLTTGISSDSSLCSPNAHERNSASQIRSPANIWSWKH